MLEYAVTLPIRWGDMDAYGHLNNVNYFRLLEEVRIQWLMEMGFPLNGTDSGPVVISVGCEFLKSVIYPASVEIRTRVEKIGRSSIDITHTMHIVGSNELCGRSKVTMVWIDFSTQQSTPLPERLRTQLERYS